MDIKTRRKKLIPEHWVTPREAAEKLLGHPYNYRNPRVIYNMKKQVERQCRLWLSKAKDAQGNRLGIPCEKKPNGWIRLRFAHLVLYAERTKQDGWEELLDEIKDATEARR